MNCEQHEFVVFSTELSKARLLVQCVKCQIVGAVADPTESEWSKSFQAPTHPFRWTDSERVKLIGQDRTFVVPITTRADCGCPGRQARQLQEFERYPGEITLPILPPTSEEREDLFALAELAQETSQLCSRTFAEFLRKHTRETGIEPTGAVRRLAAEVEEYDQRGLHFRSGILAMLLKEAASIGMDRG
jgi:hypothetical protein